MESLHISAGSPEPWLLHNALGIKRAKCIKGLIWPPLEPKTERCFSPISSDWLSGGKKSGICSTFTVATVTKNWPPK